MTISRLILCVAATTALISTVATPTLAASHSAYVRSGGPDDGKQQSNWNVKVNIDIDWKAAGSWLAKQGKKFWNTAFTTHPTTQAVFEIEGRKAVVIPITSGGTQRITNNTRPGEGLSMDRVRILFGNLGGADPASFRAQQKYDEKWGSDGDRSEKFTHNDIVKIMLGGRHYFAGRSEGWRPGMCIILADPDMTPDQLAKLPGVTVKH